MDPNDAIPPKKESKKRKSVDVEVVSKEPEKKAKIEHREKQERRRSETKEVDGHLETHTTLSPKTPPGDPPEPEELIKVIYRFFFNGWVAPICFVCSNYCAVRCCLLIKIQSAGIK